jgi:hypothetical protein
MASLQTKTFVIETEENPLNSEPAIEESVINQSIIGDQTTIPFNRQTLGSFYMNNDDNISQLNFTKRKTDLTKDEDIIFKSRATNATKEIDLNNQNTEPNYFERSTTIVSQLENNKIREETENNPKLNQITTNIKSQITNKNELMPIIENKLEINSKEPQLIAENGKEVIEKYENNITETKPEK